jgi:hypothetical protein
MAEKKKEETKQEEVIEAMPKRVGPRLRAVEEVLKLVYDQMRKQKNEAYNENATTAKELHIISERVKMARGDIALARQEYEKYEK